jgi:hypothetical protein
MAASRLFKLFFETRIFTAANKVPKTVAITRELERRKTKMNDPMKAMKVIKIVLLDGGFKLFM